ncbi:phasin family protein [Rhizobium jaguaris]|uniref:Phasin family protein n=1 Tax=Rhizobium jaguaris TaxID=1312183 RepID=A0A387FVS9_9HYPH|nr:phasin family protein [Rhizobium jaguaris]AYG59036.1 phasin family protein [Rhizobium jaguaris]
MFNFDEANKKGKEAMDTALKSYSDVTKGFQAIAAEAADFSKKSFQDSVAHFETLAGVKSFEAAFELQSNYVKSSYENFIAEATKMSEMYADLAKTAYKPYEAPVAAATKAASKAAASVAPAA